VVLKALGEQAGRSLKKFDKGNWQKIPNTSTYVLTEYAPVSRKGRTE
jgi:hypothetical protein